MHVVGQRQPGRHLDAAGGVVAEPLLHDAVLARVVAEHRAAPAGGEEVDGLVDRRGEDRQLVVHLDAHGLERARGGVAAARVGPAAGMASRTTSASSDVVSSGRAATMARAMRVAKRSSP